MTRVNELFSILKFSVEKNKIEELAGTALLKKKRKKKKKQISQRLISHICLTSDDEFQSFIETIHLIANPIKSFYYFIYIYIHTVYNRVKNISPTFQLIF